MTVERRLAAASVFAALAGVLVPPASDAHARAPMWSLGRVLTRIDGARVRVGTWSGRVQAASTLCNGEGRGRRWGGLPHWRHFTCTWTVFDRKRGLDRDVTFRVHTLSGARYVITDARVGAS